MSFKRETGGIIHLQAATLRRATRGKLRTRLLGKVFRNSRAKGSREKEREREREREEKRRSSVKQRKKSKRKK